MQGIAVFFSQVARAPSPHRLGQRGHPAEKRTCETNGVINRMESSVEGRTTQERPVFRWHQKKDHLTLLNDGTVHSVLLTPDNRETDGQGTNVASTKTWHRTALVL